MANTVNEFGYRDVIMVVCSEVLVALPVTERQRRTNPIFHSTLGNVYVLYNLHHQSEFLFVKLKEMSFYDFFHKFFEDFHNLR